MGSRIHETSLLTLGITLTRPGAGTWGATGFCVVNEAPCIFYFFYFFFPLSSLLRAALYRRTRRPVSDSREKPLHAGIASISAARVVATLMRVFRNVNMCTGTLYPVGAVRERIEERQRGSKKRL